MNGGLAVRVEGVRRAYHGRTVLDIRALDLPAGATTAVLGPSGSGKSTLLGIAGLLERPDGGTVTYDGEVVTSRDAAARRRTAAVFQRPFLFKGTIAENVAYGLRLRRVAAAERAHLAAEILERVGLGGWGERSALTLSGGEAQRVALARALVLQPRLLLLDEPLASLDPVLKQRLAREFADTFADAPMTVMWVTHDQDEALTVSDRVVVLNEGRVMSAGHADEVMGIAADEWSARFLGTEPAVRGLVAACEEGLMSVEVGGAGVFAAGEFPVRTEVLIGVRPEDVLLFEADAVLPLGSARNRIRMRVTGVEPRGTFVRVTLEAGWLRLASSVSRASADALALGEGVEVLAVFKATAVRSRKANAVPRGAAGDII